MQFAKLFPITFVIITCEFLWKQGYAFHIEIRLPDHPTVRNLQLCRPKSTNGPQELRAVVPEAFEKCSDHDMSPDFESNSYHLQLSNGMHVAAIAITAEWGINGSPARKSPGRIIYSVQDPTQAFQFGVPRHEPGSMDAFFFVKRPDTHSKDYPQFEPYYIDVMSEPMLPGDILEFAAYIYDYVEDLTVNVYGKTISTTPQDMYHQRIELVYVQPPGTCKGIVCGWISGIKDMFNFRKPKHPYWDDPKLQEYIRALVMPEPTTGPFVALRYRASDLQPSDANPEAARGPDEEGASPSMEDLLESISDDANLQPVPLSSDSEPSHSDSSAADPLDIDMSPRWRDLDVLSPGERNN